LIADDFRIQRMTYEISQLVSQGYKVIILSLEGNFDIGAEDSWWMNQLPLSEMTKIGSTS
jgi:3-phosphoglycerate kinase